MEVLIYLGCWVLPWFGVMTENPQWMVVLVALQSVLVVIVVSFFKSIWYSYVLFLVFLGGLMVIFTYVGGLTTKMKLDYFYNSKYIGLSATAFMVYCGVSFLSGSSSMLDGIFYSETSAFSSLGFQWSSKLYLYVVIYLFLTFFCICYLVKSHQGPLRVLS